MAKWGKCDYRELQRLQKKLEKMQKAQIDKFCEEMAKELAARLLAKVIRRTPVGENQYEIRKVNFHILLSVFCIINE